MIRDGKVIKRRDGTKGQNEVRGVQKKVNQLKLKQQLKKKELQLEKSM